MGNIAIHTENLGKRYRLGATVDLTRTFREAILDLPKKLMTTSKRKAWELKQKMLDPNYDSETPPGTFWALRDINLDIKHGDVVGIIGRNGAGKSTLLKILSRITTPTKGFAEIHGRVGSLLEVGTGFHPELTGRENIYLNGSILGMTKVEIDKKFDEIVAFAEVEQFLDTPLKRYSSGMQVRLAFAVAAHLEPEILVVDEVLAVGDAAFQKKSLGKMEDVSKEGRTVLFVSHNMNAIKSLCEKTILLERGKIKIIGETDKVVNQYLTKDYKNKYEISLTEIEKHSTKNTTIKLINAKIVSVLDRRRFTNELLINLPLNLILRLSNEMNENSFSISIVFLNYENIVVFHNLFSQKNLEKGIYEFICHIPKNLLNDEHYKIKLIIFNNKGKPIIRIDNLLSFRLIDNNPDISIYKRNYGVVRPKLKWTLKKIN